MNQPTSTPVPATEPAFVRNETRHTLAVRELFWHNVMREMLMALSVLAMQRRDSIYDPKQEEEMRETFDGRLAIITDLGQRVPIAEVHPLFACSVPGTQAQRDLSMAVQCTVFQIRTPAGEVHTLPLHEIRAFHALSDELIERLKHAAAQAGAGDAMQDQSEPFGFAAFTSLSKTEEASASTDEAAATTIVGPETPI
ncbi:MAG: hypothetical protein H6811_07400 [Phycisphaeraceae bacterium]|nr:hypothetical protein [Phycisphaeraceae bacterium]